MVAPSIGVCWRTFDPAPTRKINGLVRRSGRREDDLMAKARERSQLRLLGLTGRKRSDLLIGTALQTTTLLVLSYPAWAQPAPNAMPTGGSVVAGSAAITQTANATTINQSSQRA